jgi:medium-chain acyl-[acyl-carrier-protein] hydrolase
MSTSAPTSRWLWRHRQNPSAPSRVFCLPFAGGTSKTYSPLALALGDSTEVCAIEYPGRGTRFGEPLIKSIDALVEAMAPQLLPWMDRPFALLGYSMGAHVAFELARWLRRHGHRAPTQLLVAASRAPHLVDPRPPTYGLPEATFIAELRALNGIPAEVLAHPELMKLLVPIARADLEAIQTHRYRDEPPLEVPITAFGGTQDPLASTAEVDAWRAQSTAGFNLHLFNGGHFFLQTAPVPFHAAVAQTLAAGRSGEDLP